MRRKIIRQGIATNTISLPIRWVTAHGLQPGDEIELEEEGSKLVLFTHKEKKDEKIKLLIPAGASPRLCRRYVNSVYRKGYDEIHVEFSEPQTVKTLQGWMNHWVGFEIIEQGKNSCVIKNIMGPPETDFHSVFRRYLHIILDSSRETLEALKTRNQQKITAVIEKDFLINRLYLFSLRLINKKGHYFFPGKETFLYLIVNRFEEIADVYRDICISVQGKTIKISEKTFFLLEEVNSLLEELTHLYYKFDEKGVIFFDEQKDKLTEKLNAIITSIKSKEETIILHYLLDIVTYIYETVSPIFAVSMKEEFVT